MKEWFLGLSALEQVYFWLGVAATAFLIIQIIIMCFTSFGGDLDLDGDGEIDVDTDSGVSIFTVKSITAFFAIGGWTGLLMCALLPKNDLQWVSLPVALIAGAAAMAVVVLIMRAMLKLQCNGALDTDKLVGKRATVYVTIPAARSGRGKITLNAQGKFLELDAVTEGERLATDESVEILATENECALVRKVSATVELSADNAEENA